MSTALQAPNPPKRNYKNRLGVALEESPEHQVVEVAKVVSNPPSRRNSLNTASKSAAPIVGSGYNVPRALEETQRPSKKTPSVEASEPDYLPPFKHYQPKDESQDGYDDDDDDAQYDFKTYDKSVFAELVVGKPDVVIGEDVEIRGDFQYDGLLQLLGRFEGKLLSSGDLYVGPKAVLKSNITSLQRVSPFHRPLGIVPCISSLSSPYGLIL